MPHIEHIALWVEDIDRACQFYADFFGANIGALYTNSSYGFTSRFLTFISGARIEIMKTTAFNPIHHDAGAQRMGLTHLAIALGSEKEVDRITAKIRAVGYPVLDEPQRTGDGYYESVVLDPDGNRIELTI